ncbi:hypothetical protein EPN15_01430 [Patescibacteria group bacterium]|nr:MAG: hypothetical protein EPN15_01430 [Patescibacteria group bacterium]
MRSKTITTIVITAIVAIIVTAGWVMGIKTLSLKQEDGNTNASNSSDTLVYTLKENGKVSFYKSMLDRINPKQFYLLTEKLSGISIINNIVTIEILKDFENNKYEYFALTLSGDRSLIDDVKIPDNQGFSFEGIPYKEIRSANGGWTTKVEKENMEEVMGIDGKLIIQNATEKIVFNRTDFPHSSSFNFIRPERFFSENTFFVTLLQAESDPGGAIGLYQIDLKSREIKEIIYIADNDYPFSYIHLQPSTRHAYYIHDGGKILTQINTSNGGEEDIYSSLPDDYRLIFQPDEKTIIFNPPFDSKQATQVFDIQTKTVKTLPVISGEFRALSSDKKYLVYSKYSEKFSDTPFSNSNIINSENRKIQITEYHVLDIKNKKDEILFTNKMVLSDSGNYVGMDGKEYAFVGLITAK